MGTAHCRGTGADGHCRDIAQSAEHRRTGAQTHVSCAGIDLKQGYITDYDDLVISRDLIREHSDRMVLLLNSDKLHTRAFSNLCPLSMLDTIIVDERISPEHEEILRSTGVELIIAPILGDTDDDQQYD